MIYTIKITDQADNDIRNIYEYIAYELQSPENASGQLDRIEKCIMSLDDMPERYRFYDRELWKSRGLGRKLGHSELVPYMCQMDYISVDMMGGVLHRTKTLATGGDCCDFYVCKKGSKWDTTEKNR